MSHTTLSRSRRNVTLLALVFIRELERHLGTPTMHVLRRKAEQHGPASPACVSHDFCDANAVMLRAFSHTFARSFDFNDDADDAVMASAWALARRANFRYPLNLGRFLHLAGFFVYRSPAPGSPKRLRAVRRLPNGAREEFAVQSMTGGVPTNVLQPCVLKTDYRMCCTSLVTGAFVKSLLTLWPAN